MSEMIVRFHQDERGIVRSWDEVGELVRCKDCKRYDGRQCGVVDFYNTENDFCSRAELRGEQNVGD